MPDPSGLLQNLILARSRTRVARLIAKAEAPVGPVIFDAVRSLAGASPARALVFLEWLDHLEPTPEDLPWILRSRAVGLRLKSNWSEAADLFLAARSAAMGADRARFALGAVDSLARAGKPKAAVRVGKLLYRELLDAGLREEAGRACINIANAYLWMDRFESCAAWYTRGLDHLPADAPEVPHAMLGLSSALLHSAETTRSRDLAIDARSRYETSGNSYLATLATLNLAVLDRLEGHPERSIEALKALETSNLLPAFDQIRVTEFLADALLDLGLFTEARSRYACIARSRHAGLLAKANAQFGLGIAYGRSGQPTRARRHLTLAQQRYEGLGNLPWVARCVVERCELAPSKSDILELAQALRVFKRSRCHRESQQVRLLLAQLGAEDVGRLRVTDPTLKWRVHALRAERSSQPLPYYRRMLKEMLQERARRSTVEGLSAFFRGKERALEGYFRALLEAPTPARIREAAAVIHRTRSATLMDEIARGFGDQVFAELVEQAGIRPLSPPEGVRQVRQRQGVSAMPGGLSSLGPLRKLPRSDSVPSWLVLGNKLVALSLNGHVEIREAVNLNDLLRRWEFELGVALAKGKDRLNSLLKEFRSLFGDVPRALCPSHELLAVPWSALAGDLPVLCLHPSLSGSFQSLKPGARGLILRGLSDDLPHVSREVEAICARFANVRAIESVSAFRDLVKEPIEVDFLHACGHAEFYPENPMMSALLFADGPLRAWEVARSGLKTNLAVLSACETGRLSGQGSYEPEGLVRAFLACGAGGIVASQWLLNDDFAADFMSLMYQYLSHGVQLDRAARLALQVQRERWPGPQYWGAIALFGGLCQSER